MKALPLFVGLILLLGVVFYVGAGNYFFAYLNADGNLAYHVFIQAFKSVWIFLILIVAIVLFYGGLKGTRKN